MAKQRVSDAIQKQFEKPQFQPGTAVFFSWMGYKQVGYVKKFKKSSWGIQYIVESTTGVKYPCGIEIKGQKTHYNTGYIHFEETRSNTQEDLIKRFQNGPKSRTITTVSIDPGRPDNESTGDSKLLGGDDSKNSGKDTKLRRKKPSADVATTPSSNGVDRSATKKRKVSGNAELEAAIQKQRSFLDFTKPMKKD